MSTLDQFKSAFADIVEQKGLLNEQVDIKVKPLTTKQAIGTPDRDDFPLQKGKERILEARFMDSAGQAFTDSFKDHRCDIAGLLELDLSDRFNASIFIAAANAVLRHLGMAKGTVHCRDKEPTLCAPKLVEYLKQSHPEVKRVAMVGLQPAMAEALAPVYDLAILDLDPDNIGTKKAGAIVRDGRAELEEVVAACDLVLATGSTLSNLTMDLVRQAAGDKPCIFFGTTISGGASLLNMERFCPMGH